MCWKESLHQSVLLCDPLFVCITVNVLCASVCLPIKNSSIRDLPNRLVVYLWVHSTVHLSLVALTC